MSIRTSLVLLSLSLSSIVVVAGCATDTTNNDDAESGDSDLSAAGKALIGSYKGQGSIHGLILTAEKTGQVNAFIADLDNGLRCITTPCPSSERVTGTFTAGTKTINLKSETASDAVQPLLGRYDYKVEGNKISLSRHGFSESLAQVDSYCTAAADCEEQGIIHPMCVGNFSCTPQNTCSYQCGLHNVDPCAGLELQACTANAACQPRFGASSCTPNGICTADRAFKGCEAK